ncbi:MAG: hypothetical protein K2Y32_07795 [Candidatus Obscuribacterales bacterium]|nr:hypothetical protein [Candidatus Obscuribacterales bacterium]
MRRKIVILSLSTTLISSAAAAQAGEKLYISSATSFMPGAVRTLSPIVSPVTPTSASKSAGQKSLERGLAEKKKGNSNQALICFLQASKEDPKLTKAFYEQALIFRDRAYVKLAESSLNQALSIDPNFHQARLLLAAIKLENGNVGTASRELNKTLGLDEKTTAAVPVKNEAKAETKVESKKEQVAGGDNWTERLRFLNEHGTNNLKPGEAFMFSEESGEALLILADGRKIRRQIAQARDNGDLVKERRPELLLPKEFLYKLSTQSKIVEPERKGAISDFGARTEVVESLREKQEEPSAAVKAVDKDMEINPYLRHTTVEEIERYTPGREAETTAPESEKSDELSLKQAESLPEEDLSAGNSLMNELNLEAIVDKTQKFFGWLKKSLHLP